MNGALNAVVHVDPETTLAEADDAERALAAGERRPLLGLPVSIKDSIAVRGRPCRSGSYAREHHVPEEDATTVARLREAGAVFLCKTNVPEYTWSTETDNAIFGRTNNPYDLRERPAARAAARRRCMPSTHRPSGRIGRACSIRVPAHFCGTVGLRPSVGRVPETGACRRPGTRACSTWPRSGRWAGR